MSTCYRQYPGSIFGRVMGGKRVYGWKDTGRTRNDVETAAWPDPPVGRTAPTRPAM